jgi:hypothetical protein
MSLSGDVDNSVSDMDPMLRLKSRMEIKIWGLLSHDQLPFIVLKTLVKIGILKILIPSVGQT